MPKVFPLRKMTREREVFIGSMILLGMSIASSVVSSAGYSEREEMRSFFRSLGLDFLTKNNIETPSPFEENEMEDEDHDFFVRVPEEGGNAASASSGSKSGGSSSNNNNRNSSSSSNNSSSRSSNSNSSDYFGDGFEINFDEEYSPGSEADFYEENEFMPKATIFGNASIFGTSEESFNSTASFFFSQLDNLEATNNSAVILKGGRSTAIVILEEKGLLELPLSLFVYINRGRGNSTDGEGVYEASANWTELLLDCWVTVKGRSM